MSISLEWWTGLKVSSREAKVRPFNSDGMNDEGAGAGSSFLYTYLLYHLQEFSQNAVVEYAQTPPRRCSRVFVVVFAFRRGSVHGRAGARPSSLSIE